MCVSSLDLTYALGKHHLRIPPKVPVRYFWWCRLRIVSMLQKNDFIPLNQVSPPALVGSSVIWKRCTIQKHERCRNMRDFHHFFSDVFSFSGGFLTEIAHVTSQHTRQSTCTHLCNKMGIRVQHEMKGAESPDHLVEPACCIPPVLTTQL